MKDKIFGIIFLAVCILFFVLTFARPKDVESNLLAAFITPTSYREVQLSKLANLSAKQLNVMFEADNYSDLEQMRTEFFEKANDFIEIEDYSQIAEIYKQYPRNFLTDDTRKLIQNNKFSKIREQSLQTLYNPMGIYILPPDKDPYLLVTDFVMQNGKFLEDDTKEFNNKIYKVQHVTLSGSMEKIVDIQKELNESHLGHIYLTGTPVHAASASAKSVVEINLICIFSTLALIFLCKYYFKTFNILIPIALSIIFGFLSGYAVAATVFPQLHVLTFVFSTSLIGISLDYSLHYFLTKNEKNFKKSLTISMLTTVLAFSVLYFSDIQILKQISILTSFGLLGVYCFVIIILPLFKFTDVTKNFINLNFNKLKKIILTFVVLTVLVGSFNLKFDDNIKNFYTPQKSLLRAEKLYKQIFGTKTPYFLTVSGKDVNEILQKEEKITDKLGNKNISYLALSNFISSRKTQRENQALVHKLYENDLSEYATFLDKKTIDKLKNSLDFDIYDPVDFPLNAKFMLDENTSFIATNSFVKTDGYETINIAEEISQIIKFSRHRCMLLFPIIFVILSAFLCIVYGWKNALKTLTPPMCGALFAVCVANMIFQGINLFHILAMFLIIGFSLDYSIFRLNGSKKSNDAVLISCISSALSFLLLSFTSFKLVSSLGLVLFLGITSSYILSVLLISPKDEIENI